MPKNNKNRNKLHLSKPRATPELLRDISYIYNVFNSTDTPQKIYEVRNDIHELMRNYSNIDEINDATRHPEKYGVTIDPNDPTKVLIPLNPTSVFPGYEPIRGEDPNFNPGSISGYRVMNNLIPEGAQAVDDLSEEDIEQLNQDNNLFKPDFLNTYLFYTYPMVRDDVDFQQYENPIILDGEYNPTFDLPSEVEPADDSDIHTTSFDYDDFSNDFEDDSDIKTLDEFEELPYTLEYVNLSKSEDVELFNPTVDDNILPPIVNDDILPSELDIENEYFPTALNLSIYSPTLDYLYLEPELPDETFDAIFANRPPGRSMERKKIILPEEMFVNMSSLDKIKYDMALEERRKNIYRKDRWILSPEAEALLNYLYEQYHPIYEMPHPLTWESMNMHPVSYPDIPLLGLFFNPITRKYIRVKN